MPYDPCYTVISCFQYIAAHLRNTEVCDMTRVVWDCNYLEEVCGACTM